MFKTVLAYTDMPIKKNKDPNVSDCVVTSVHSDTLEAFNLEEPKRVSVDKKKKTPFAFPHLYLLEPESRLSIQKENYYHIQISKIIWIDSEARKIEMEMGIR